jgi:aminoglycoside 3-N-acetyltransferase
METLWTFDQLCGQLRDSCGVKAGDNLIIHSSAGAVGKVEGGVVKMLHAIKAVVTEEGTIMMPVFSDPKPDGIFKMKRTPSRVGLLTEALRRAKGTIRSKHPTHSMAVWGKHAAEFAAGHELTTAVGAESPMHKAARAGADVMMIGCKLNTCTLVHLGEALFRVPYLGKTWYPGYDRTLTLVDLDGSTIIFPAKDAPGDGQGFMIVQEELERRGQIRHGKFGDAEVLRFNANDCLAAVTDLLKKDLTAVLCKNPRCCVCVPSRKIVEELKAKGQG